MSLSDFIVMAELATSSAGKVLKARKRGNGEIVVLKERRHAEGDAKTGDVMREVQLLSSCAHPNIIRYIDHFRHTNGSLYIILEYAEQGDLFDLIEKKKKSHSVFSDQQIWAVFKSICRACAYLHERGIVHRDLKSKNIFVMADGTVKLGDFGIGRQMSDQTQQLSTLFGTPLYLSPELCKAERYNEKTDVWSLGVIMYEMCALRHPFSGKSMIELSNNIVKGERGALPSSISPTLQQMIDQLLQVDPTKRPSMKELLTAMPKSSEISQRPTTAPAASQQQQQQQRRLGQPTVRSSNEDERPRRSHESSNDNHRHPQQQQHGGHHRHGHNNNNNNNNIQQHHQQQQQINNNHNNNHPHHHMFSSPPPMPSYQPSRVIAGSSGAVRIRRINDNNGYYEENDPNKNKNNHRNNNNNEEEDDTDDDDVYDSKDSKGGVSFSIPSSSAASRPTSARDERYAQRLEDWKSRRSRPSTSCDLDDEEPSADEKLKALREQIQQLEREQKQEEERKQQQQQRKIINNQRPLTEKSPITWGGRGN